MASFNLHFITVDVFTSTRYEGNPLAVVFVPPSQRSLATQEIKQRIAREFNLSETVFLHAESNVRPDSTTLEVNIFTSEEELPFAGHPTIGTAYLVVHHLGWSHVDTLLTKAGPIPISAVGAQDVKAEIPHAVHVHSSTLSSLLDKSEASDAITAGLSPHDQIRQAELSGTVVSIVKGMTFILVKLPSLDLLAKVTDSPRLQFDKIPSLLDKGEWEKSFVGRYYYVYTEEGSKTKVQTRMVELGFEDPATGSAGCTLGAYLTWKEKKGAKYEITQGVEMGRRSGIVVETSVTEEGQIKGIQLGGTAVVVMKGSVAV
ncbi:putative epimerase [Triangularia verruculosa]|uniref:Epimerase n=1 Tax=Triangularia verruculosa TaxID=2587418 RepID=A0AAN6X7F9_9PEZI|nr:putative epimerase [Triangularia verruculosa]